MSSREWFDPPWEETKIVLVDTDALGRAQRSIRSCEACKPDEAQIPFDHLLDCVTGCDPAVTDYVLLRPARCPRCTEAVTEKTLVVLSDDNGGEAYAAQGPIYSQCLR